MPLAGDIIEVGRIPGWPIGETVETADSVTFTTTETIVSTLTVPLVSGRTYNVYSFAHFETTVAVSNVVIRIREDNVTGTQLQSAFYQIWHVSATGIPTHIESEYTAVATGNKTFVLTGVRTSGTGVLNLGGGATFPSYLRVEYVSG